MLGCNTNTNKKPKIAVTTGDPAGIGPEIVYKALQSEKLADIDVEVVGPLWKPGAESAAVMAADSITPGIVSAEAGNISPSDIVHCEIVPHHITPGKVSAEAGKIAYDNITCAVELALSGQADAVATAPINKESLKAAGVPYIGHTEIFAALTNTDNPLTMFQTGQLRVFFLTRHLSLKDMLAQITKENIVECARKSFVALRQVGIESGTIAIAGLNPHCGEHGLFGCEEQEEIVPAVQQLKAEGYSVEGPIGADSVFAQAAAGKFDAVLSLYHDQGHIATKTLDFYKTISLTCGMPFLRTSVDHGTAFDIAGQGIACEVSMVEAISLAAKYCNRDNACAWQTVG